MSNFQSLFPELQKRIQNECIRENTADTETLVGVPYPYVTPGAQHQDGLYYWDTYFINLALLKFRMIDQARHNVENLIFLLRKYGYVPAANLKSKLEYSQMPLLPWMVRDVYRATGDKDWLSRMLPDVIKEYNWWTTKPHTSPVGLFRFKAENDDDHSELESCWVRSSRFDKVQNYNPVDLNALLYRNAELINDLQFEVDGESEKTFKQKSKQIKNLLELCWDEKAGFYFDNNFAEKKSSPVKSLAGFMPLFVKMVDENRAAALQKNLADFIAPGGITITDQAYDDQESPWNYPLVCAPYVFFVTKAMADHEFMEDAADIGVNWLQMVFDVYRETGELWEWYNARERSNASPNGLQNTPVLGWTAGAYVALVDTLGVG